MQPVYRHSLRDDRKGAGLNQPNGQSLAHRGWKPGHPAPDLQAADGAKLMTHGLRRRRREIQLQLGHGAVVIAAITSCTNTSNPAVMLGAGLVAKSAVERGLTVKPWVKTSLAPGSRVVTEYLREAGLLSHLEALGFDLVGYGCTTCIGNSGPLPEPIAEAVASAIWWWPACCRAIATSRGASTRWCG